MSDQGFPPYQPARPPFSVPGSPSPPGPSFSAPRWCPHHHPVSATARFCDACGAPVATLASAPAAAGPPVVAPTGPLTPKHIVAGVVSVALVFAVVAAGLLLHLTSSSSPTAAGVVPAASVVPTVVQPATTTVSGTFTLDDDETADHDCTGQGGYSDISPGATVILTDESGKILGASTLGPGSTTGSTTCEYTFVITDVPEDALQYAVEVTHRGKVVSSRQDLEDSAWTFELTLGT